MKTYQQFSFTDLEANFWAKCPSLTAVTDLSTRVLENPVARPDSDRIVDLQVQKKTTPFGDDFGAKLLPLVYVQRIIIAAVFIIQVKVDMHVFCIDESCASPQLITMGLAVATLGNQMLRWGKLPVTTISSDHYFLPMQYYMVFIHINGQPYNTWEPRSLSEWKGAFPLCRLHL